MLKPILSASAIALLAATPALSQEISTSADDTARLPVIYVAGLRPVDIDAVTSTVSVLDAEQLGIRDTPYVADQLRAVPGVTISRSGSVGSLTQVRMRGAEANHTLVLLDGVEFSDPVNGETDFGLLSGLDLGRVEVLSGEQSSLYGSDAIGGVIALYTSETPGLRAAIEGGSFGTVRGSAGYNTSSDNARFGVAVSGFTTDGVDSAGLDGEKDGSDSASGLVQAAFDLDPNWTFSGLASYRESTAQTDPDTDFDGFLNNGDRETESEQMIFGGALSGTTGPVDHVFRANFNRVERTNYADGQYTDETVGERSKVSWSPSITLDTDAAIHTFSAIVDYENEDYTRASNNTAFGDPNQSKQFETLGAAVEYRLDLANLQIDLSARHDENDGQFEDATTWRAGAGYSFDFGGHLRASAGEGVKNPTFTELFGFYPGSFIGNPDLNPEKSMSWEVGYDQTIGNFAGSITYFHADLEDEIYTAYTATFASTPANRAADSERSGVEVAARWDVTEGFVLNGQVTQLDSQSNDGTDEIRVPDMTASLAASWVPTGTDMRFGAALDYVGEQDDFNFGTFPSTRETLDAYVLASLTAEFPVTDRLAITLRGENLFDEEVTDVFGYHGTGAGAFIGLKLR